jgi:hypothetical protein
MTQSRVTERPLLADVDVTAALAAELVLRHHAALEEPPCARMKLEQQHPLLLASAKQALKLTFLRLRRGVGNPKPDHSTPGAFPFNFG